MRSGDPGWEITQDGVGGTWAAGGAVAGGWVKGGGMTWGTPFSLFRFTIPELCGFQGTAVYMDADMLVLDDLAKLVTNLPARGAGYRCTHSNRTDVSVIDCSAFDGKRWWPSIEVMKRTRARTFEYMMLLKRYGMVDASLPHRWNDVDGQVYEHRPDQVSIIHYSNVLVGQPWRPYPNVRYPSEYPYCRTSKRAAERWFEEKSEMEGSHAKS